MKRFFFQILPIFAFITACSPVVTTHLTKAKAPLKYNEEVYVLDTWQEKPANNEYLGELKIGDSGFSTHCGFFQVIQLAQLEARKAGGNVIKLTDHDYPNPFGSTCHRIKAEILKVDDIALLKDMTEPKFERDIDSTNYALLHIYRNTMLSSGLDYDLYLGNKNLGQVKEAWRKTLKIKTFGQDTLWTTADENIKLPITIKNGKEYYIVCSIRFGGWNGIPDFRISDVNLGEYQYNNFEPLETVFADLIYSKDGKVIECNITRQDIDKIYFSFQKEFETVNTFINKSDVIEIIEGE